VFNNPSVGAFLASMSAGHLIGIPVILGPKQHWGSEVAHWQQSCFDAVIRIEEQSA
jgi:hypothetical protein